MKASWTKINYKEWWKRNLCITCHSELWEDGDDREETIDAILEDREPDPLWYCPKCDKNYSKSIYKKKIKYYSDDTGPR
tara:strand:- start:15348 stop:15584 length:237 start_codon:yes stop_codon:yes gene_type:complete